MSSNQKNRRLVPQQKIQSNQSFDLTKLIQ